MRSCDVCRRVERTFVHVGKGEKMTIYTLLAVRGAHPPLFFCAEGISRFPAQTDFS